MAENQDTPIRLSPQDPILGEFVVQSGTKGYVRRSGAKKWEAYTTKRRHEFRSGIPHGSTHIILSLDGWELMVALTHTRPEGFQTVLGRKGRGWNRRERMRR